ncbi:MAG: amidohydrolase family protein [Gammaproteobacteria bacterium]|jgi:predicted TIM-barrel fold metal-dependent hydrolase|nr:amidohydrolase family protein [Gammaproteobacteria bacterium]MBT3897372.1 amidohydrolase family protein [Gammaproteobacteria bacterium]MDA7755593.1 amidohydrolase [Pseudomonadales bacterium]MDC0939284.1 amidohydrolase family protein [Pseudomonadales bacterium]
MPYIENRLVHDADSHLMEMSDCLNPYFEKDLLRRFLDHPNLGVRVGNRLAIEDAQKRQRDEEFRADAGKNIMLRKNYDAQGAFLKEDRPAAVDHIGAASQLVFTTFCLGNFGFDQVGDPDLCYGTATAHNRMMTDFCSVDRRLLATAYIPLEDFNRAIAATKAAIAMGAKALMIPSWCPQDHSPTHTGLFPVWAMAEEAGLPILFHVGGEDKLNPTYKKNGLPAVPDFHGGDANFTSISYIPISTSVQQTLATFIIDGIFDKFPNLKWGAIELGASWLPGWLRNMDSAAHAFVKNEERLQKLSAKPSEIARRQLRVTPYPHEDTGWIIRNSHEEMCLFSTDYPHVEGGRNPLKRFSETLGELSRSAVDGFYAENFIDMMGEGLAPELRRPAGNI